jgi:NADPH:quinone reductase-like Zn-dependent oxidoreductase
MLAAVIESHGGPETINVREVPSPKPGAGEVLLKVRAAGMNHIDLRVRRGGRGTLMFPHVLGSDAAGTVAAVGRGVPQTLEARDVVVYPGTTCGQCPACRRGQDSECETFGLLGVSAPGTFAQYVVVSAASVAPKPEFMSFEEAAAVTVAYLTAWRMLYTRAGLAPGQRVLVHGVGGGVALAALQLAVRSGAEVLVTSSSNDKLRKASLLGAAAGFNYKTSQSLAEDIMAATDGAGVDVVIDSVGAATIPLGMSVLRKGGKLVLCGVTGGPEAQVDARALYWNQLQILGSTLGTRQEHRDLLAAMSAGRIKPAIDAVYPLAKVVDATRRMEGSEQFGKLVLTVPE